MLPGPSELLIIFGVALLLFGPSKLPQLGSAIGESIRNFRKGMKPIDEQDPRPREAQTLLSSQTQAPSQAEHKTPADAESKS